MVIRLRKQKQQGLIEMGYAGWGSLVFLEYCTHQQNLGEPGETVQCAIDFHREGPELSLVSPRGAQSGNGRHDLGV
jgi:hypothetical protein